MPAGDLVGFARERFVPVLGDDGRAYAVPVVGPAIAVELHPHARDGLRSQLARMWFDERGRVPGGGALAAAVATLAIEAEQGEPVPVAYRVARLDDGQAVVDLGRPDGWCIIVGPDGWQVAERSPVLFRRSALTGELPLPADPGSGALDGLRQLVECADDDRWRTLLAWLVVALLADVEHPVLALSGGPGSGKTTAARFLVGLVDPGPVPLRRPPRDLRTWATVARGSWLVALDGVSPLTPWLADILARAVDGSGMVWRRPRGDVDDVSVLSVRCPVLVTTRDLTPGSGALAGRLVTVGLAPIPAARRRPEAELAAAYESARPLYWHALLDLTARVLATLPDVDHACQLGDFGRVLAAVDACERSTS